MTLGTVSVEEAVAATPEVVEAFARLVPQLSRSATPPGEDELAAIVEAPGTTVLLARLRGEGDERIVGTLTLVVFHIPTGIRAWIEDVVVEESSRGRGVGAALIGRAVELSRAVGARTVDLTSRPSRQAANRLYLRLGFHLRDSQVFRYEP